MRFVFAVPTIPAILATLCGGLVVSLAGCDTGFGQPCDIPSNISLCEGTKTDVEDGGVTTETSASCAINQYARCETQVCLTYKGSDAFCSMACLTDSDCPGSAVCKPIIGDDGNSEHNPCEGTDGGYAPECYCVKASALR